MAARKTKKPSSDEDGKPLSFEESMTRLSKIVSELEEGELSLEESLERFEEGVRLARTSQTRLDEAESRVEKLLSVDDDGEVITEVIGD
jgi:exodeoxyribonuclease VII small subunit